MTGVRKLYDMGEIAKRISELAFAIESKFEGGQDLKVVSVLSGSFVFAADLIRMLRLPLEVRFVMAKSYAGTSSAVPVDVYSIDNLKDLEGKDVLLVEDIVDTGKTLQKVLQFLRTFAPRSLRSVSLLNKPFKRQVVIEPDWTGFVIQDQFVVGYGLDYNGAYRGLPYIGVLVLD